MAVPARAPIAEPRPRVPSAVTKVLLTTIFAHAKNQRQSGKELVAISSADGDAMATLGAAAGQNSSPALGLHTHPETMGLGTVAAVGLKCALRHGSALLYLLFWGDFAVLVGIDFLRYLRDFQYSRSANLPQKTPTYLRFSQLVVQLPEKRFFSLKDTLRAPPNRASIGFVQERNLHVRLSHCRSTETRIETTASRCKLRAHERTTAHPAGIIAGRPAVFAFVPQQERGSTASLN
jgi:hypothetical protein